MLIKIWIAGLVGSNTNAVFFRSGERNFEPWADSSVTRVGFVREEERLFFKQNTENDSRLIKQMYIFDV